MGGRGLGKRRYHVGAAGSRGPDPIKTALEGSWHWSRLLGRGHACEESKGPDGPWPSAGWFATAGPFSRASIRVGGHNGLGPAVLPRVLATLHRRSALYSERRRAHGAALMPTGRRFSGAAQVPRDSPVASPPLLPSPPIIRGFLPLSAIALPWPTPYHHLHTSTNQATSPQ